MNIVGIFLFVISNVINLYKFVRYMLGVFCEGELWYLDFSLYLILDIFGVCLFFEKKLNFSWDEE